MVVNVLVSAVCLSNKRHDDIEIKIYRLNILKYIKMLFINSMCLHEEMQHGV